ncbi:MAG: rhomboid family intramembrane serine protease [Gammaproteobacteria bacterium]|nr:rhomboid family intramembrane serine protease [Gammaproteobacteria bacterium]
MLNQFIFQLQQLLNSLQVNVYQSLEIILALWVIQVLNYLLGYRLNFFGIVPRDLFGIIGIPLSPLLHSSFSHLFFNSIPLFALSCFLLISGEKTFMDVTLIIVAISGTAIWLFGRPGVHIGASSVIMGYFSYLMVEAYMHPSVATWVLAGLVVYYFGGLFLSLFPQEERVSWEGHLFGFAAGLAAVWLLQ